MNDINRRPSVPWTNVHEVSAEKLCSRPRLQAIRGNQQRSSGEIHETEAVGYRRIGAQHGLEWAQRLTAGAGRIAYRESQPPSTASTVPCT